MSDVNLKEAIQYINGFATHAPVANSLPKGVLQENQTATPGLPEEQLSGIDWTKLNDVDQVDLVSSLVVHLESLGYDIAPETQMGEIYQLVADDPDLSEEASLLQDLGILEWELNPHSRSGMVESMVRDGDFRRLAGLPLYEAAPGVPASQVPSPANKLKPHPDAKLVVKPKFKAPPKDDPAPPPKSSGKLTPGKLSGDDMPAKRFAKPGPSAAPGAAAPEPRTPSETTVSTPKDKAVSYVKNSWAGRLAMKAGVGTFSKGERQKIHQSEHDHHEEKLKHHEESARDAGERLKVLHGQVVKAEKSGASKKHTLALRIMHKDAIKELAHHASKVAHHAGKKAASKAQLDVLKQLPESVTPVDSDLWASVLWTLAENYDLPDDMTTAEIAQLIKQDPDLQHFGSDPQFASLFEDASKTQRVASEVIREAENTFEQIETLGLVIEAWNALQLELDENDEGDEEDSQLADTLDGIIELVSVLDEERYEIPLDQPVAALFECIELTPDLAYIYESADYQQIVEGWGKTIAKHAWGAVKTGAKLAGAAALIGATGGTAALAGGAAAAGHLLSKGIKTTDKHISRWANDKSVSRKAGRRDSGRDGDDDADEEQRQRDEDAHHRHVGRLTKKAQYHQAEFHKATKQLGGGHPLQQYDQYAQLPG